MLPTNSINRPDTTKRDAYTVVLCINNIIINNTIASNIYATLILNLAITRLFIIGIKMLAIVDVRNNPAAKYPFIFASFNKY